jgi:hypothetical protein
MRANVDEGGRRHGRVAGARVAALAASIVISMASRLAWAEPTPVPSPGPTGSSAELPASSSEVGTSPTPQPQPGEPPAPSPQEAVASTSAAQPEEPQAPSPRPGRYQIGPFYLTPSFKIGTIGMDTNTLYTPTGPRADMTASGGPGLEIVLPVWRSLLLRGNGTLMYLYYLRTPSERRLMGAGSGRLEWNGNRTSFALETAVDRERARPSLEVDQRVLYTDTAQRASLRRTLFGRMRLSLNGQHDRREVDAGEEEYGVDLRNTMTHEDYRLGADLDYGLTVKTSVAATYEHIQDRFPFLAGGTTNRDRLMGGLRTDATALISGQALAGVQWVRPQGGPTSRPRAVCDVDALLNASVKTHVGVSYRRDYSFSMLAPTPDAPTVLTETYGARLDKDLVGDVNLQAFARRTRLWDDGNLSLALPDGRTYSGTRRDIAYEAGADLGYRFRGHLRLGVAVSYLQRHSTVSYFGIKGLLVGLSAHYNP